MLCNVTLTPDTWTIFSQFARCCTVAIGKPERQARKASHCSSKQQQRSHAVITLGFR